MRKTTIYLPDQLKRRLERLAREQRRSEAEVIRTALEQFAAGHARPRPRLPIVHGDGSENVAENVDAALAGFGED